MQFLVIGSLLSESRIMQMSRILASLRSKMYGRALRMILLMRKIVLTCRQFWLTCHQLWVILFGISN